MFSPAFRAVVGSVTAGLRLSDPMADGWGLDCVDAAECVSTERHVTHRQHKTCLQATSCTTCACRSVILSKHTFLYQNHVVKLKQCHQPAATAQPLAKVASQLQPQQQPVIAGARRSSTGKAPHLHSTCDDMSHLPPTATQHSPHQAHSTKQSCLHPSINRPQHTLPCCSQSMLGAFAGHAKTYCALAPAVDARACGGAAAAQTTSLALTGTLDSSGG